MATWGSQTWGFSNWGTLGDTETPVSGIQLNSQQGNVSSTVNPGWGGQYWGAGEWGDLSSPEILLTGNSLTTSITSVAAGTDFVFQATGLQLNTTIGNAVSGISQLIIPTTLITTTSVTSVFAGELVEVQVTSSTTDQWGFDTWGQGGWGVGDGLSTQVGVTGVEAGATAVIANDNTKIIHTGTAVAGASAEAPVTGISITSEQGQEFAGPNIEVQVTSPSRDPWGEEAYGEGAWGIGDGTSINLGSTTPRGNAVVQVTAVTALTISEGTADAAPDASVTGVGMTITSGVGTVTAFANLDITGVQANFTIGNETVSAEANVGVTGSEITGNTGQLEYEAKYLVTNGSENVVEFTAYNQAQLSTAQAKFGTASLLLDGTNDYVESNSNVNLSSGDFTIDVWIRPTSVSGYKGIWQSGTSTTMQSYLLGNAVYWSVNPSTIITTAVTVNANEWTMLSFERQGNTHRIYKNGTLADTATTGNKQDNGPFSIGENGFGDFNGYIDEFRLSDTARYGGSSFTEPTGAFVPDSNTTFLLHMDGANGSTNIVDDAPGVTIARFDIGEHFAGEVVAVQVTTASAQPWGEVAWGDGQWGQSVGTDIGIGGEEVAVPSVEVDVTGIELSSNTGNEAVTGDSNLLLTGIGLDVQLGDEDAFTNVRINVSGNDIGTIVIGDYLAGISAEAQPSGVTMTTTTGIMSVNAWAVVDPGTAPTWTPVDKAA